MIALSHSAQLACSGADPSIRHVGLEYYTATAVQAYLSRKSHLTAVSAPKLKVWPRAEAVRPSGPVAQRPPARAAAAVRTHSTHCVIVITKFLHLCPDSRLEAFAPRADTVS